MSNKRNFQERVDGATIYRQCEFCFQWLIRRDHFQFNGKGWYGSCKKCYRIPSNTADKRRRANLPLIARKPRHAEPQEFARDLCEHAATLPYRFDDTHGYGHCMACSRELRRERKHGAKWEEVQRVRNYGEPMPWESTFTFAKVEKS